MLEIELIKQILIIAIASGCVTTLTIQKIKKILKSKKVLFIISFIVSMIIGTLFAKSFSGATWIYCVWAGFFTWIDADLLYKLLEDKIFKPFGNKDQVIDIKREDKNEL